MVVETTGENTHIVPQSLTNCMTKLYWVFMDKNRTYTLGDDIDWRLDVDVNLTTKRVQPGIPTCEQDKTINEQQ